MTDASTNTNSYIAMEVKVYSELPSPWTGSAYRHPSASSYRTNMSGRTLRSKDAPMDFQWTNRNQVKPVWSAESNELSTPKKRPHGDLSSMSPNPFENSRTPAFGSNQNVPFMFQSPPAPQISQSYPWVPPPQFSPLKAFPKHEEPKDVDMSEISPEKQEELDAENGRPIAMGGLRRVYNQRQKSRRHHTPFKSKKDSSYADSDSEGDDGESGPLTQNTSHHFTLNMPAPAPPPSDTPYILLGYLQFFFNLSLILLFLYLVVQFILTVQRDVEHRISEYSQDIVQEIAMCALQYKSNLCTSNAVPAMTQQCANWEACMNRDPTIVGRAKVGAELIAEVVNGFVEPISWKTLIFTLTSLAFLTVFINALLSLYRSRHQPIAIPPSHPPPTFPMVPATPYTPHYGYSPASTPGWPRYQDDQDLESPTRRRRLDGGGAAKIK